MSGGGLDDEFKVWNPMRSDYADTEFNKYCTGIGADLDESWQPGQLAKTALGRKAEEIKKEVSKPYLVLKHVRKEFTVTGIYQICASFGSVDRVTRDENTNIYFVRFHHVGDLEAVHRALQKTDYGFNVYVGNRNRKKEREAGTATQTDKADWDMSREFDNKMTLEGRSCHPTVKQPARPHLCKEKSEYEYDAHTLERAGLKEDVALYDTEEYKYRTGRVSAFTSEKILNFLRDKNIHSFGTYNIEKEVYVTNNTQGVKVKKCAICNNLTDSVCALCHIPYCCVNCQRKDWNQHRFECGVPNHRKFAKDVSNSGSVEAQKQKPVADIVSAMPRSGQLVEITCISSTNCVFIRSKAHAEQVELFKMLSKINDVNKAYKSLVNAPVGGQMVLTKYEGQYNRAIVSRFENTSKIKVHLMDFGNSDYRKLVELYEAPENLFTLQGKAIPVILKGIPKCYMTEEVRHFMYSHLEKIVMRVLYSEKDRLHPQGIYKVDLIDAITNQNFNTTLIKMRKPALDDEHYWLINELPRKVPTCGENMNLVVMDNSFLKTGIISCTLPEYAREIEQFNLDLQTYAKSIKDAKEYAPRVNEVCLAKYKVDSKWYRGQCHELVGDGFPSIIYFDYGNLDIVSISDIRPYPKQLAFPIHTVECEINGLPKICETKLVNELEKLLPIGSTITCEKLCSNEEGCFTLTLTDVIQELVSNGVLKP